jgi:hypothetical protein
MLELHAEQPAADWDWRAHYAAVRARVAPGIPREHLPVVRPKQRARPVTRYAMPVGPKVPFARDVLALASYTAPSERIIQEEIERHKERHPRLSRELVLGVHRSRWLVSIRHRIAWRLHKEAGLSLIRVAGVLGYKEHSAVLHAVRKYQKLIDEGRAQP